MKIKGIGYGTAFAIIVLTLITLMSTYYIIRTYSSAETALENYAISLQKPQLEVTGYNAHGNQIVVYLVNKGPGAVVIKDVKLYKQDVNGVPTGTTDAIMNGPVYVPVGGTVDVTFDVSNLVDYVFWNKPIRLMVLTNKGILVISYPTLTGVMYVNIHLPSWINDIYDSKKILDNLMLNVRIPGYNSINIPLSQAYDVSAEKKQN